MKANPGGHIAPEEAIGREQLIDDIWRVLESQSIYMNSERRIGKTTILEILAQSPRRGWRIAKKDLEGCHTPLEFATAVCEQIHEFLGTSQRAFRRVKDFVGQMGGTEIGGVLRLPEGKEKEWKTLLEKAFEDLQSAQENGPRILFLWDEVPFMIDNIRKHENEKAAMEVLDVLRFVRQTNPTVRMIMTGSVGLHHVLTTLRKAGYANEPTNDMMQMDVPVLTPAKGAELAESLIRGEEICCDDTGALSRHLADAADHFPFYIHHLVRQLKLANQKPDRKLITEVVQQQLTDPNDPWKLRHYRTRIPTYYGADEESVLSILDVLAKERAPLGLEQIAQKISATVTNLNLERLRSILRLLECDHYLVRKGKGYIFKYPLIGRWWRLDRSIS
jgi:hypothetical protein